MLRQSAPLLLLAGFLFLLTGCPQYGYKFDDGRFPSSPVNFSEVNSVYDDYNSTAPFIESNRYLYFSSNRKSQGGEFDIIGEHMQIFWDKDKGKGNPFFYFAYGMAVSEVEVDILTGYVKLKRTDIINDVGNSLHPEIDLGQVRGAFIQGLGWVTTEDIKYDAKGKILNASPDTYKIPVLDDIPEVFNVELLDFIPNPGTIHGSKAVGEPPFMLALSVWMAIRDALFSLADHEKEINLGIPATNENILLCIRDIMQH